MGKMMNEFIKPKDILTLMQGNFSKNGRKKNYTIKVSIILENNDYVENYKELIIMIDDWDLSFFDHLVKLNEEEIERFKNSKKREGRIP
jgi:hypothetical protein